MSFKRVISFRPTGGASERGGNWTRGFEQAGIDIVHLALLEIVPVLERTDPLAAADESSWLLFTSANAVWFSLPFLRNRSFSIACVGEQTAALLRESSQQAQFVPTRADAKSFAAELIQHLQGIDPKPKCIFLRGRVAAPHLALGLKEAGIAVDEIVVYESRPVPVPPVGLALLRDSAGADDTALLFTSSESIRTLVESVALWEIDLEKLRRNPCFAIGPETEKSLREAAFAKVNVAAHASLESLVDSVLSL